MPTARTIVTDALDLIMVHAAEEPLSAHQEQQGLRVLNDLLQSASLEHFLIYYTPPQVVPWPAGRGMLTWGPGGDIATPRPVQIGLQAKRLDVPNQLEYPMAVFPLEEYRTLATPVLVGDPMQLVAYGANYPLGELYCWPVPQTPQTVTVYPWHVLTEWPDFDTDLLLPPGYDRYLKGATACELAPYYDKEPSPTVQGMRAEAKQNIKTVNLTIPLLAVPWFADPFHQQSANDY
jgi:hypothetical protein